MQDVKFFMNTKLALLDRSEFNQTARDPSICSSMCIKVVFCILAVKECWCKGMEELFFAWERILQKNVPRGAHRSVMNLT